MKEAKRWSIEIDKSTIGFTATSWINSLVEKIRQQPEETGLMEKLVKALNVLTTQSIELDLWKAQNLYFSIERQFYNPMKERVDKGEDHAKQWIETFHKLGPRLYVKVPS